MYSRGDMPQQPRDLILDGCNLDLISVTTGDSIGVFPCREILPRKLESSCR